MRGREDWREAHRREDRREEEVQDEADRAGGHRAHSARTLVVCNIRLHHDRHLTSGQARVTGTGGGPCLVHGARWRQRTPSLAGSRRRGHVLPHAYVSASVSAREPSVGRTWWPREPSRVSSSARDDAGCIIGGALPYAHTCTSMHTRTLRARQHSPVHMPMHTHVHPCTQTHSERHPLSARHPLNARPLLLRRPLSRPHLLRQHLARPPLRATLGATPTCHPISNPSCIYEPRPHATLGATLPHATLALGRGCRGEG